MNTGSQGTFVISWSQTETDGVKAAPLDLLTLGVTWRWGGEPVRVDGPSDMLRLEGAEGAADLRRRAARMVRRLIGAAVAKGAAPEAEEDMADQGFALTDGHETWVVTLLTVPDTGALLLMVLGEMPPRDRDLWVTQVAIDRGRVSGARGARGVICFTPDTMLATPGGPRLIQSLRAGDLVLTRDAGPQPVLWTGHRRMTGARLYAMPHLRPIRIKAEAMGAGQPQPDLVVSPQHRIVMQGPAARALFNSDEVLVRAEDLVNDTTILLDRSLREVTYVHVLLEAHQVIWANGVLTESFHPAHAALDSLDPVQRAGLMEIFPGLAADPTAYGPHARRNLSGSEAAILRHDLGI
ncbi:Hint domain-containing protein [Stagnihabitans tardus]|uniref:Hemolysin-type calcium-binding protein n=1 Tax=Stagnihabitans tardus TaxID=2699202 RepID=A0AAE4Y8G2_9RHOB|nr:Hint domain-containing protein [Stagnihabitans tardus]NBZ87144.1 hemolysin-type calcium-binding protein [Stagnihabitans tardus]